MPQLLDGKLVAEEVYQALLQKIPTLKVKPKLSVILVGDDPASVTYTQSKASRCLKLGLDSELIRLPSTVTESELLQKIQSLNADPKVHGILVQLPLPTQISKGKIMSAILPEKDVDGFHPLNSGFLFQGNPKLVPCTPLGMMEILKHYKIPISGARAVVLGRSEIVGKPMAQLLLMGDATVTVVHSKSRQVKELTAQADIVVAAIGKPKFLGPDFIREGAVVIDVGIHRIDGKICGDVDFERVSKKTAAITPVPGGVGPMTIAMLMKNVVTAAEKLTL